MPPKAGTPVWSRGETAPSEWIFQGKSLPEPIRKCQSEHTAKKRDLTLLGTSPKLDFRARSNLHGVKCDEDQNTV